MRASRILFGLVPLLAIIACTSTGFADRDALWRIMRDQCVAGQVRDGAPTPCTSVDLAKGDAVLRDTRGTTQYLLIPTMRVTGIEDPSLLDAGAPDYFADAWAARHETEAALGRTLPREDVALAVNSAHGRSQDQLHIHIDCVRADVRDALAAHAGDIGDTWAAFPVALGGHSYMARHIAGDDPDGAKPFLLLADGIPGARADMGRYTLVLAGLAAAQSGGFVLLADHADEATGDRASGAALLDHACVVAGGGGPAISNDK